MASTLERNSIPYDYVDLSLDPTSLDRHLQQNDYLAIGSGGLVADFFTLQEIFTHVKKTCKNTPCIMGGHIIKDVAAETVFARIPIDFSVIREAELTLPQLLEAIAEERTDYANINGIVYRGNDGLPVKTPPQTRIVPSDLRVFPSYDFFDHAAWVADGRTVPVLTGRGCPGACTFCSPSHRKFLPRQTDDVFKEIEIQISRFGASRIEFLSEVFFDTGELAVQFCNEYKERIGLPFECLMRADASPEVLRALKDAGCVKLGIGIESGSDKVLRRMGKGIVADEVRSFVAEAKRIGFKDFVAGWILNNEMETEEDVEMTVSFNEELDIRSCLGFTVPYPGTAIYKHACRKGLIKDEYGFIKTLTYFYTAEFVPDLLFLQTPQGKPTLPNLTDIPDEEFIPVMVRAFARFYGYYALRASHLFKKNDTVFIHGECPACNRAMDLEFNIVSPLQRNLACPGVADGSCYNDGMFHANIFTIPYFADHARETTRRLKGRRVGILGDSYIAKFLLAHNIFGLLPDDVVGISSRISEKEGGYLYSDNLGNFTVNSKILSPQELVKLEPEFILAAEMPPGSFEIENILVQAGYDKNRVLHMCPSDLFVEHGASRKVMSASYANLKKWLHSLFVGCQRHLISFNKHLRIKILMGIPK